MFGDRAYFDLSGPAALVVEDIRPDEAGVYRCRVDFKSAPTRNTLVNVTLLGIKLIFFCMFVSNSLVIFVCFFVIFIIFSAMLDINYIQSY